MKGPFSQWIIGVALMFTLVACSSNDNKQHQIEAIAKHRAKILSNNLPVEHGPLTIMQARSKGNIVELMMIYNEESAIPPQKLLDNSINYYCSNSEIKSNLELGLVYNVKLRSTRGQLLFDQIISLASCTSLVEDDVK